MIHDAYHTNATGDILYTHAANSIYRTNTVDINSLIATVHINYRANAAARYKLRAASTHSAYSTAAATGDMLFAAAAHKHYRTVLSWQLYLSYRPQSWWVQ